MAGCICRAAALGCLAPLHSRTSNGIATLEPTVKRRLTFAGRFAGQKTIHADVLVQIRPVNARTATDQAPPAALFGRAVNQPWKPRERYDDGAAVGKLHRDRFVGQLYVKCKGALRFNR